jgi:hypothetical protein
MATRHVCCRSVDGVTHLGGIGRAGLWKCYAAGYTAKELRTKVPSRSAISLRISKNLFTAASSDAPG